MRTVLALALAVSFSAIPAAVPAKIIPGSAPADEYFGRFRASILEIRNRLDRMDERSDRAMRDRRMVVELNAISEEVLDWQQRYPNDPWLPKTRIRLARNYHRANAVTQVRLAAAPEPREMRGPEP